MRPFCRGTIFAAGVGLLMATHASTAWGEDLRGDSTIRSVPASHSMDEPPALPVAAEQPALPAAASAAAESPPPTSMAEPESVKVPVARLPFRRSHMSATTVTRAIPDRQITNQARQALGFYGGNPARQTLSQFPRRTPIQAGPPVSMRQQIKPFHSVYRDPTVSPYLNLYREEDDTQSAPNYYAFVRPQLEQIEASRLQQGELQQMVRQLQSRSRTVATPQYQSAATPGASTPARYMDTAQFYGGWAR